MSRLRAVILDVDGTLIDSNDAHAHAWVDACGEQGFQVAFGDARRLIGMGGDKVLPRLTGLSEEDERGARLKERRGEIFRERYLTGLSAFPAARDLLERLKSDGLILAVATSASAEDLKPLLERAGIADLIDQRTNSDDAEESKPDPDIVRAALRRAGVPPDESVMLGDTPYDVEASGRAGVPCIALRCGGWDDQALGGAVAIYQDPAELLARYDQSPLGRGLAAG
jgi:HAD superfamily hydrolase (TIGR01509 family)